MPFDLHLYNATSVLFVCVGNICRSPMAVAIFNNLVRQEGLTDKWYAESVGTKGWHVGQSPDERAMKVLRKHNVSYDDHVAIRLRHEDFYRFDYIFGMDTSIITEINRIKPKNSEAKVFMLGAFDPEGQKIIPDPYYDSNKGGFERTYSQILRSCKSFLDLHK